MKNKAEVDFVLNFGNNYIPIGVKYILNELLCLSKNTS